LLASPGSFFDLFLTSTSEAAGQQMGSFRKTFLELLQSGVPLINAIKQAALDTPGVLEDPNFPQSAQSILDLLTPSKETFKTAAPGAAIFAESTGKVSSTVPAPSATEKLVEAILAAKTPEEQKLLERGLAGTDGRLTVTDYLKLVAGGVTPDPNLLPRAITTPATQEQATIALTLGQATGPRAPNTTDMLLAAMGIEVPGSPLNNLDKKAVRDGLLVAEQLRRAEAKPGPLDAILSASPEARAAGLGGAQKGGLAELFKKLDEAEGVKTPAPGPGEVPIFGAAAAVGGTAGQAPGPAIAGALSPEQIKTVEKMPPENFAELSPETLAQITRAVIAKTLTLSDEQRTALFKANQANQANQGGAGGRAQ